MRLAWPREQVKPERDGVVCYESAHRAEAVDSRHESAHQEKACKTGGEHSEIALELLVGRGYVRVGEENGERTAEDATRKTRDLAAA